MARIRTIKPSFFRSDDVSALPLRARLTWIGLWTHCDDQGRAKDNTKLIKADVWPLDPVSLADVEEDLETLADHGRIVRYEVDGKRYLAITNWGDHQAINRPTPSRLPGPVDNHGSYPQVNAHAPLTEDSHREGKGKEGKGRDARPRASPPKTCPQHPNGTTERCGPCKDARLATEATAAEKRQRVADAPQCRTHRGQPAHNCALCRADQLAAEEPTR